MAEKSKTKAVLALQRLPDEFEEFKRVGVKCGLDPRAMEQLVTRLQGRPASAAGRLKMDELVEMFRK